MSTVDSRSESWIERLKPSARDGCANAYAPYSNFPVGAAAATRGGAVFTGCNVENASFGLTICAERNALSAAVAQGVQPGDFEAMLIYTPGDVVHSPCGACRQVMHELLAGNAIVISCCDGAAYSSWGMDELLPEPFEL